MNRGGGRSAIRNDTGLPRVAQAVPEGRGRGRHPFLECLCRPDAGGGPDSLERRLYRLVRPEAPVAGPAGGRAASRPAEEIRGPERREDRGGGGGPLNAVEVPPSAAAAGGKADSVHGETVQAGGRARTHPDGAGRQDHGRAGGQGAGGDGRSRGAGRPQGQDGGRSNRHHRHGLAGTL